MKDSEKMRLLIDALGTNANALSIKLGYKSGSSIAHILNGVRGHIPDGMIQRITEKFPNVNYLFLKKGEHPVLLEKEEIQNQKNILNTSNDVNLDLYKSVIKLEYKLETIEDKLNEILKEIKNTSN